MDKDDERDLAMITRSGKEEKCKGYKNKPVKTFYKS